MSYGQIIAAGEVDAGATVTTTSRTTQWLIMQHQSTNEIIATFDEKYPVHLSKDITAYVKIPGNYQSVTTSGNGKFHYVIFG